MKNKFTKVFSVIMCIALFVSTFIFTVSADGGTLKASLSVSDKYAHEGDEITVSLSFDSNPGFMLLEASLGFDSSAVEYISGDFTSNASMAGKSAEAGANSISLTLSNATDFSETGKMASFKFKVLAGASSASFTLTKTRITSLDIADISTDFSGTSVTVSPHVDGIALNKNQLSLNVGESETLVATISPASAQATIKWTSSDESVATVDNDGKVTAIKGGTSKITAKADGKETSCLVTVYSAMTGISVPETLEVPLNGQIMLSVTYLPEGTTDERNPVFVSSDESVATVDAYGKIKGLKEGTAEITVTCGDFTDTCTVTVAIQKLTGIKLNHTKYTIKTGSSIRLKVSAEPELAELGDITWSSTNPAVAKVSSNGRVTAVYEGEATITAKCGDFEATCKVTVTSSNIDAKDVTLDKSTLELEAGQTGKLNAEIKPSDSTDELKWSSSDTSIATVDEDGNITAISAGVVTITVKAGEYKDTCTVTVTGTVTTPSNIENISLSRTEATLSIGQTLTLSYTISPHNASASLSWYSTDDTVLIVNDGVVSAIGEGTATVIVTCGGKVASCEITVLKTDTTSNGGTVTGDETSSDTNALSNKKQSSATTMFKVILIIIVVLLIAFIVVLVIYFIKKRNSTDDDIEYYFDE